MIKHAAAVWSDLDTIIRNPADGTRSEIEQLRVENFEAVDLIDGLRKRGIAWTTRWDGRLMFAMGHFSTGDVFVRSTWCVMAKACDTHPRMAMLAARSLVNLERKVYPGITFEAWSISRHPKRDGFLTILGFERIGDRAGIAVFQLPALERCRNLC